MIPPHLLPVILRRSFPLIDGAQDLPRVVALLEARGGEFCASLRMDADLVARVCRAGFLPMSEDATGHDVLLIKSHLERCVLLPGALHRSRSTRRHARGLELRIDHSFERCLAALVNHHPDRWLTPPLCDALVSLHRAPLHGVALHSVEVYDDGELVAGEVGCTTGAVYTSLSGFHRRSGSGRVQLEVLGLMLERSGFAFWDLGMPIEYKISLGSIVEPRRTFLARFQAAALLPTPLLPERVACEPVLRGERDRSRGRHFDSSASPDSTG